jgi:hypothetical protein
MLKTPNPPLSPEDVVSDRTTIEATQLENDIVHVSSSIEEASAKTPEIANLSDLTLTDATSEIRSADAFSSVSSAGLYEVIEYDINDNGGMSTDFLNEIEPDIQDNTPAAEALKANAQVHVSSMGKAARAMHMQTVRKFVKRATGQGKSGIVRGKPPRLPPRSSVTGELLPGIVEESIEVEDYSRMPQNIDSASVIPEAVVAGTVEAGKKGECIYMRIQCGDARLCVLIVCCN